MRTDVCIQMCIHICVGMFIGTHIGESTDVFSDVFVDITGEKSRDICVDMRVDMRVDMCGDMYVDMCGDMGVDIIVDMCVGLESGVPRELLWAERFFFCNPRSTPTATADAVTRTHECVLHRRTSWRHPSATRPSPSALAVGVLRKKYKKGSAARATEGHENWFTPDGWPTRKKVPVHL